MLLLAERRSCAVSSLRVRMLCVSRSLMRDVVVCHSVPVGILVSIGKLIVGFRILEDDVPCVEKTGEIS
jgi:hypothetical protein